MPTPNWREESVTVAGIDVHFYRGGEGPPLRIGNSKALLRCPPPAPAPLHAGRNATSGRRARPRAGRFPGDLFSAPRWVRRSEREMAL